MKVFKRSGSSYYAYKFQYRNKEYYRSTGTGNRREAEAIAAAARARVIRQTAGLEEPDLQQEVSTRQETPKSIPTLREFQTPPEMAKNSPIETRISRMAYCSESLLPFSANWTNRFQSISPAPPTEMCSNHTPYRANSTSANSTSLLTAAERFCVVRANGLR
jgi:hypothetical protein